MSRTRAVRSRRPAAAAVLTLAALAAGGLTAPPAAAAPYCGLTWGSTAKAAPTRAAGPVVGVRAGEQACYDRLVVDLGSSPAPGWHVAYVDQVRGDATGTVIPTRGGARLEVVAHAPAYTLSGAPAYVPADRREVVPVTGYRTFRQVVWAGSFEGDTTLGLGVRARLPFRVTTLAGPGTHTRLVVDVAHAW